MTLLDVTDLTVRYGGLVAVDSVSLSADRSEIVGLIGPNGAGKTTLIDALTGFARHGGRITFDGEPIDRLRPHQRARRGLVRTFQSLELFDDLSVRENLLVAASTPRWWSPLADAVTPRHQEIVRADEVLDLVGLQGRAEDRPTELSNGQRHLLALARAVVGRPKLVLLDEPAAGLDATETTTLARTLRRLPGLGIAVLLVDHDMGLVLGVCNRLYVVDFGSLIAAGAASEVRTDPDVIRAYLGAGSTP